MSLKFTHVSYSIVLHVVVGYTDIVLFLFWSLGASVSINFESWLQFRLWRNYIHLTELFHRSLPSEGSYEIVMIVIKLAKSYKK